MVTKELPKSLVLGIMAAAIVGVVLGFKYLLPLFWPFIFGYFIAWLAAPIVTFLTIQCRIPRGIASFLVVVTFLFVMSTAIFFLGRALFGQIKSLITNLPLYEELLMEKTSFLCRRIDRFLGLNPGTIYQTAFDQINTMVASIGKNGSFSGRAIGAAAGLATVLWNVVTTVIASLLIVREFTEYKESFRSSYFYQEIHLVTGVLSNMGIAYLKAQFIMMCIIAAICTVGLLLIRNGYALVAGIGIAIFDAFPVLGSAFILVPWCLILLFEKRFVAAAILAGTYVLCQITRQLLEPKLVGDRIGIKPVYTLAAMYVGLKIYGAFGFFLGPISLVAIKAIVTAAMNRRKGEMKQSVDKTGPLA